MKRIKYIILLLCITLYSSCSDILDKKNLGAVNDIWNDKALVEAYVSNLYTDIPGWDIRILDNIADEGRCVYPGRESNALILSGEITSQSSPLDYWAYKQIRKCNDFFISIETSEIPQKNKMIAEVKFLRAFQYFLMVMRYGGVPLITSPQGLNDDLFVSRASVDECFDFIDNELSEAAKIFEEENIIETTNGRASKGAALALKAKVLLYYASPLFNPQNETTRWKNAAEAAKLVMGMNYSLYSDFSNIHQQQNNNEIIFKKEYKRTTRTHGRHDAITPLSLSTGDVGFSDPVQELVDAFPMVNGKDINDPESGYDPNDPYKDRDPRFYATIVYNGSELCGRTQYTYVGYPADGIGAPGGASTTGYYCKKAMNEALKDYNYDYGDETCFIHIRLADIYLMYAEAQNEYVSSPDESIYEVLEKIRKRAGLNPFQIPRTLTKEKMRNFIRNERYIELAFEQNRYWDLRRWKLATERLNGKKMHGMAIKKLENGSFDYTDIVEVESKPIVFKEYMYFNPIPYSEIISNPNLEQNPGY